jgi:hypothetical protein
MKPIKEACKRCKKEIDKNKSHVCKESHDTVSRSEDYFSYFNSISSLSQQTYDNPSYDYGSDSNSSSDMGGGGDFGGGGSTDSF